MVSTQDSWITLDDDSRVEEFMNVLKSCDSTLECLVLNFCYSASLAAQLVSLKTCPATYILAWSNSTSLEERSGFV